MSLQCHEKHSPLSIFSLFFFLSSVHPDCRRQYRNIFEANINTRFPSKNNMAALPEWALSQALDNNTFTTHLLPFIVCKNGSYSVHTHSESSTKWLHFFFFFLTPEPNGHRGCVMLFLCVSVFVSRLNGFFNLCQEWVSGRLELHKTPRQQFHYPHSDLHNTRVFVSVCATHSYIGSCYCWRPPLWFKAPVRSSYLVMTKDWG